MKLLFASIVLATGVSAAFAADQPSLSGQWKVHNNIAGNESDQDCTFTQKDGALSGSCKSDQATLSITGKVSDKDVTWQYTSDYNGQALTIVYTAPLPKDGKITGTVNVKEMSVDGDFTATQGK